MKSALIIGIGGQDGSFLAQQLLARGYRVVGTSRDPESQHFINLKILGIYSDIEIKSLTLTDFSNVVKILRAFCPDEVYNLAGQTSVNLSFEIPSETFNSIAIGTLNLLEAIKITNRDIKFFNAASSECFGDSYGKLSASELTQFNPGSPYSVAKAAAYWLVNNYRDSYGLYAVSGILGNHESYLRHPRFVTRKIVMAAVSIASSRSSKLELGNINISRDWGWAPEYTQAIYRMLQCDEPQDYVIATGTTISLKEFVDYVFKYFKLDYRDHLELNPVLHRPHDILESRLNAEKAKYGLGWVAETNVFGVIDKMIEFELENNNL